MAASDWWRTAGVYQVYPRSFADGDGDGVGDLAGVTQHLDHLEWLGVGAVWLSPFYPSGGADNGYDVSDHTGVDPVFGTLDDFDALVDDVHRRGMRLIVDQVFNHTSDEHPWFTSSRSSATDDQRDWYFWRPPRRGFRPGEPGAEPNNWRSFFGGPAWTLDEVTGEYYLHLFHRKQPDLNWEQPGVRSVLHDVLRWWIGRGVDGFRLDVINLVSKPAGLPDAPSGPGSLGDPLPLVADGPRLVEHLVELRSAIAADDRGTVLIGEVPGSTPARVRQVTDPATRALDLVIPFDHLEVGDGATKWERGSVRASSVTRSLAGWQEGLGDTGWSSLYLSSHDQPRAVSRLGDTDRHRVRSATTLATVLHLHRGTPFVYQGEEIAMANRPYRSIDDVEDVESKGFVVDALAAGWSDGDALDAIRAVGRDNARTPMQWTEGPHAGFSTGKPWIGVNPDHAQWNVAAQRAAPDSVLHHYRWLLRFRRDEPVVSEGSFEALVVDSSDVYAFARELGGTRLVVVANLSSEPTTLLTRELLSGDVVHADPPLSERPPTLRLEPWECRIHRLDTSSP